MYRTVSWHRSVRVGLVAVLVLALAACGGGERPAAEPLPEEKRQLRQGVYRSEEFRPPVSFAVGEGWKTLPPETSDALVLGRGEETGFAFIRPQQLYEVSKSGLPTVVKAPDDMVAWFRRNPYLRASEPEAVTVGGIDGVRLDMTVENLPEGYAGPCVRGRVGDCLDVFKSSVLGWIAFPTHMKHRVVVFEDVGGQTVIVTFGIPATRFDEEAPEAQEVIDSVKWRNS